MEERNNPKNSNPNRQGSASSMEANDGRRMSSVSDLKRQFELQQQQLLQSNRSSSSSLRPVSMALSNPNVNMGANRNAPMATAGRAFSQNNMQQPQGQGQVKKPPPPPPPSKPAFLSASASSANSTTASSDLSRIKRGNFHSQSAPNLVVRNNSSTWKSSSPLSPTREEVDTNNNNSPLEEGGPSSSSKHNFIQSQTQATTITSPTTSNSSPSYRKPPPPKPRPSSMIIMKPSSTLPAPLPTIISETTILPSLEGGGEGDVNRIMEDLNVRRLVIKEIMETEASYLKDLILLKEIYANSFLPPLIPPQDHKLLFGNLDALILLARDISDSFEDTFNEDREGEDPSPLIPVIFLSRATQISNTFCAYCKNNEAGLFKVQEWISGVVAGTSSHPGNSGNEMDEAMQSVKIQDLLKACHVRLKESGSTSWDLSSMLVKPVQRVLKYPLLISRLVKHSYGLSPEDVTALAQCHDRLEATAVLINQVKKRKDVVEKYVSGKQSTNVIHGISKKWSRGAQIIRNATSSSLPASASDGEDLERVRALESLQHSLDSIFATLPLLERTLTLWIKSVIGVIEADIALTARLEECFSRDGTQRYTGTHELVKEYKRTRESHLLGTRKLLSGERSSRVGGDSGGVASAISRTCASLQEMCKKPILLFKKLGQKRLDYDRVVSLSLSASDKPVDHALLESAEAYTSISLQLLEELPIFIDLLRKAITEIVLSEVVRVQQEVYGEGMRDVADFCQVFGGYAGGLGDDDAMHKAVWAGISSAYMMGMAPEGEAEIMARDLGILKYWRGDVWGSGEFSTASASLVRSRTTSNPAAAVSLGGPSSSSTNNTNVLIDIGSTAIASNNQLGQQQQQSQQSSYRYKENSYLADLIDDDSLSQPATLTFNTLQLSSNSNSNNNGTNSQDQRKLPYGLFRVKMIYPFTAEISDELSVEAGQELVVDGNVERGGGSTEWWYATSVDGGGGGGGGASGWIPYNFAKVLL